MSQVFTRVLSDTCREAPVYETGWECDSGRIIPSSETSWSVRFHRLHGGKQEGVELIELDAGRMSLTIVPTRGMNVLDARCDGVVLGWESPIREVVHPAWVQPETRGGRGWLDGFNEMMCRCGLESTGASDTDVLEDAGRRTERFLPLHGNISNTPASLVWFSCELEPPYRLTVGGVVRDARVFGPSYELTTQISVVPGDDVFRIQDSVAVIGQTPVEMELLYHCNFGRPLLGPGSRLVAPVKTMTARDPRALEGRREWDVFGPPEAGFAEQCYFFTLYGDGDGRSTVALVEPDAEFATRLEFSVSQLPAFTLWKNTAADDEGYVTGLEPGTDYPNPRRFERSRGRVVRLEPGQPYHAELSIGLTAGAERVRSLCDGIAGLVTGESVMCETIDAEYSPLG